MQVRMSDEISRPYRRSNIIHLVERLRDYVFTIPDGAFIGVEETLLSVFGTSRPTLRQAMRVLECEKLVTVKRGYAGGYYASRPVDGAVISTAVLNFRVHGCTINHAIEAASAIGRNAARAAAKSGDGPARRRLEETIDRYEKAGYPHRPVSEFFLAEREIADLIYQLAGNPALRIFGAIIHQFGETCPDLNTYGGRPDRVALRVKYCAQKVRAILDGDVLIVEALACHEEEMLRAWFAEDAGKTGLEGRGRSGSANARARARQRRNTMANSR